MKGDDGAYLFEHRCEDGNECGISFAKEGLKVGRAISIAGRT